MRTSRILTVGSLFSGIGGIEHGLELTGGFSTIWQCDINDFSRSALAQHWPGIPIYEDISAVDWSTVERPDVLCGGFPCQDISFAGKGEGITEGTRSGLWFEYVRAIRALRPRYVIAENVAALLVRGLDRVLCDLAAAGYDADWADYRAASFGAPHRRERIFVVAYRDLPRCHKPILVPAPGGDVGDHDQPYSLPNWGGIRVDRSNRLAIADSFRAAYSAPILVRVDDGLPDRLDRVKALGNAVVPAVARHVGGCILAAERALAGKAAS